MISKNQIKYIQSLHLKKQREQEKLFIIEGIKLVTEFLQSSVFEVESVFATAQFLQNQRALLSSFNVNAEEVTEDELKKISLQTNPNAVLAVVKQNAQLLNEEQLQQTTNLYLDDIRDPGNLGTIIRIADWFGIKQVICSLTCTELYNPKTLQASMGAVLRVNVVYQSFEIIKALILQAPIYGAVLNGTNIYTSELQSGIIVIGNEANGISEDVLKQITNPITIPAASNNGSESLNAANACAIICSEFFRRKI